MIGLLNLTIGVVFVNLSDLLSGIPDTLVSILSGSEFIMSISRFISVSLSPVTDLSYLVVQYNSYYRFRQYVVLRIERSVRL